MHNMLTKQYSFFGKEDKNCDNCHLSKGPCRKCSSLCRECVDHYFGNKRELRLSKNLQEFEIQKYLRSLDHSNIELYQSRSFLESSPIDFPLDKFIFNGFKKKLDFKPLLSSPYNMKYYCVSLSRIIRIKDGLLNTDNSEIIRESIGLSSDIKLLLSFSIFDKNLNASWKFFYNGLLLNQLKALNPYLVLSPNFGPSHDMPGLEIYYNFERNIVMWKKMLSHGINAIPCMLWNNDYYLDRWKQIICEISTPWVYVIYSFYKRKKPDFFIKDLRTIDDILPSHTGIIIVGINSIKIINEIKRYFPSRVFSFFISEHNFTGSKGKGPKKLEDLYLQYQDNIIE